MNSENSIHNTLSGMERKRDTAVTIGHHHYIVLSILNQWMGDVAAPAASGVLLDYGCGGQPYKDLFSRYITKYIGADVASAAGVKLDLVIRAGEPLDLPDHSIDTIVSSQVLEHVPNPTFYLRDCKRLLRPNGKLIITAPMQWRQHEDPYDFYRYTRYGLEYLLQENGLQILDLRPCGGAFALVGQLLCNTLSAQGIKNRAVYSLINKVALYCDLKYPDNGDTLNWNCIAISSNLAA